MSHWKLSGCQHVWWIFSHLQSMVKGSSWDPGEGFTFNGVTYFTLTHLKLGYEISLPNYMLLQMCNPLNLSGVASGCNFRFWGRVDLIWLYEETLNLTECAQNRVLHPSLVATWSSTDGLREGDATRTSPSIRIALRWLVSPCRVLSA